MASPQSFAAPRARSPPRRSSSRPSGRRILVVIGRLDRTRGDWSRARFQDELVRQSGRPVLLFPPAAPLRDPVRHLLIGWSATREATRAAHDALALLEPKARIDILTIGHRRDDRLTTDARHDLAAAFDRKGFRVELIDRDDAAGHAGKILLRTAAERGAELVATGAFGHSRLYDFVVGAVTSHLLAHAALPVLLSK